MKKPMFYGRMITKAILIAVCTVATTWVLSTPARTQSRDQEINYLDLSSKDDTRSGHVIISIERQKVPTNWSVDWYVAVYSPKGIRMGLGRLADNVDKKGKIAIRMPAGRHKFEISRRRDDRTQLLGMFDFDKGEWVPPSDETVAIITATVDIPTGGVVSLQFRYEAPELLRSEDKASHTVTVLMTVKNARLVTASASKDDLPSTVIRPHVLMKYASFGGLEQSHLIKALLEVKGTEEIAATALLKAKTIDTATLAEAIQSAFGKPTWGLARVVAMTRDKRLVPPLLRWLKQIPKEDLPPLLWALGELKDAAAVPTLMEALASSTNVNRVYAAYALGRIGDTSAALELKKSLVDQSCTGYEEFVTLADPEMNAFYALAPKRGWSQVLPVPDWCVRFVAIYALGQIGGHEALEALVALSRDNDERVRWKSCMALSRFPDPASVEALAARITDKASVQFPAVAALGRLSTDAAVKALKQFATDGADEVTRSAAKAALERIKPPQKSRPVHRQ